MFLFAGPFVAWNGFWQPAGEMGRAAQLDQHSEVARIRALFLRGNRRMLRNLKQFCIMSFGIGCFSISAGYHFLPVSFRRIHFVKKILAWIHQTRNKVPAVTMVCSGSHFVSVESHQAYHKTDPAETPLDLKVHQICQPGQTWNVNIRKFHPFSTGARFFIG